MRDTVPENLALWGYTGMEAPYREGGLEPKAQLWGASTEGDLISQWNSWGLCVEEGKHFYLKDGFIGLKRWF